MMNWPETKQKLWDLGIDDLPDSFSNADLSGADLSHTNLSGADLSGANLTNADLTDANLSGADLSGADLSCANLTNADLTDANLSYASLSHTNLSGAKLSYANLSCANLIDANLYRACLFGANLKHTCLDPDGMANGDCNDFDRDGEFVIGYRTRRAGHIDEYRDGRFYSADWFSVASTECHPGLYLWPTIAMALDYSGKDAELIKVKTRPTEIHRAGRKWRCRWFEVLGAAGKESEEENES